MSHLTLDILRQHAIKRTLFTSPTVIETLDRLGFVQIDPITAPATAQDLILRHRVAGYRKGDVERAYPELAVEEAYFINHGYVSRELAALLWSNKPLSASLQEMTGCDEVMARVLQFAHDHGGEVLPKALNLHMGLKSITNAWGGQGQEGTHIVQRMHSSGLLRIVRREKGMRVYGLPVVARVDASAAVVVDAALTALVQVYAPLTKRSLTLICRLLTSSRPDLKPAVQLALRGLDERFNGAEVDGVRWYWPRAEVLSADGFETMEGAVRLLAPFDPLVWDRDRFEQFFGWSYKFEAYKPAHARQLGYYALPMLWRDACVGWANVSVVDGVMHASLGYVKSKPREKAFRIALEQELTDMAWFLGCASWVMQV
ncbi:hypothetical protein DTO96_101555 [Ephemeroptericola cinctiostellae]|uniref:Winged helix-turn-helix domain-containing protein n=1 Tax=Ephemeroptericola cinctiostellae TaxID=2268024 RepID=A0A345DBS7_9BURK|nr:crosslink repair DNA glycosylase YcaQ family protein [Ephemeroptericola cinctiostellae]AXF85815.1 hypothetical protein DTO96_101555 [Ephemeroptericola cinctiostellae]